MFCIIAILSSCKPEVPKPNTYKVSFNSNGGLGEMKNITGDEGSEITLTANAFTRTGYIFSEWTTSEDGSGKVYEDKDKIKLTANTTLYAQWKANTYKVKFDKNANDAAGDAPADISATYDKEFELPENTFAKIGYNFAGWNTEKDGSGDNYKANAKVKNLTAENNATVTLYAKWVANTYTVTFDKNTDDATGTMESQTFTYGTSQTLNENKFTRTGYDFAGWATSADGKVAYNDKQDYSIGTEDVTLYAKWTANNYTVSFDSNDATSTMESQTFTYGTPQALNKNKFIRTGYEFAGWATSANGEVTYNDKQDYSIGTEDVTLYAKWKAIVYSITYELDGGTNAPDNPAIYTIEDLITLKDPTRDGFTFVCWYSDRSKKTEIAKGSTGDIELQAVWKDNADFVKVPAVSIKGSETWTPASEIFISGRTLNLKAFWMSDHEVTRGEYKEIIGSDPSKTDAYDKNGNKLTGDATDNNPVNMVSWYDAIVYCNKRSIKEGLTPCYTVNGYTAPDKWGEVPTSSDDTWNDADCKFEANGYRLPTEAEWEWAARGGEDYKFSGSDDINEVAWYTGNTNDTGTREVKTKKANGYGLYDMSGNVWEWCWDWHSGSISTNTPETGASSGSYRCPRGGGWYLYDYYCEVADRNGNNPYARDNNFGFRVVRTAEE